MPAGVDMDFVPHEEPQTQLNNGLSGSLVPRNMRIASIDRTKLDPVIQEKVDRLNQAKLEAVEIEDFDQAKFFKHIVDKLLIIGNQIQQLTFEKQNAIENEDYDMAKRLKYRIEDLTQTAYKIHMPVPQQPVYQEEEMDMVPQEAPNVQADQQSLDYGTTEQVDE